MAERLTRRPAKLINRGFDSHPYLEKRIGNEGIDTNGGKEVKMVSKLKHLDHALRTRGVNDRIGQRWAHILPARVGWEVKVPSGKGHVTRKVRDERVGHRFGEFVPTTTWYTLKAESGAKGGKGKKGK